MVRRYTVGIVVLVSIGVAVFLAMPSPVVENGAPDTITVASQRVPPIGWKLYTPPEYPFSLFYPEEFEVSFFDEGGRAGTITFEDSVGERGFQIFIVPHVGEEVGEERFLQDVPSGVRINVQDATVDGAVGAYFNSYDLTLGTTTEIWFARGGFLYEVTTMEPLTPLIEEVMQSWRWSVVL